jgi:hypothetical protein
MQDSCWWPWLRRSRSGAAPLAGWHLPSIVSVVPDDAFYYLEGAWRIRESGVVSVDGIHSASGYHPGWMALLALTSPFAYDSAAYLTQALVMSQLLVCR